MLFPVFEFVKIGEIRVKPPSHDRKASRKAGGRIDPEPAWIKRK